MDKQQVLVFLRDWIFTISSFFDKELFPNASFRDDLVRGVTYAFERQWVNALRMAYNDINEGAMGERPETVRQLNNILREKFGMDLCDVNKRMAARIAAILKRGKIRNDDEFVRMSEWIDHLLWDDPDADNYDEINRIERLMNEYEERAAKKLDKTKNRK